jgi:methyl-accepting chemotaxis protein
MSFETDLESRKSAFFVDDELMNVIRKLQPVVAKDSERVLKQYYATWDNLSGFQDVDREERQRFAVLQSEYYTQIFEFGMDENYLARLKVISREELWRGFGPRIRLATGSTLAAHLYGVIGRRHRFSVEEASRKCTAVLRFITVDALNAMALGQEQIERSLAERRLQVETAIEHFMEGSAGVSGALVDAAQAVEATVRATVDAADRANTELDKAELASGESAGRMRGAVEATGTLLKTVDDIGQQVTRSLNVAQQAGEDVARMDQTMKQLDSAVVKIGSVVGLISEIASQTNLLALNATIEAARAGEAGRGFAVVASEVKTLADQTSKATADIADQIKAIEVATRRSLEEIVEIVGIVQEVKQSALTISDAVDHQRSATSEIAVLAREAASGATVVQEVANSVRSAMGKLSGSNDVRSRSVDLLRQSAAFGQALDTFLDRLRAS